MRLLAIAICAAAISGCATNPAPQGSAAASVPAIERTALQNADISALQGLTRIMIDASSLYDAAAQDAEDRAYANQLSALSDRRRTMTNMFQARVAALGGNPAEIGQPGGTAHRIFMEARTLGNEDTKVAVQEALRGENYLLEQLTHASVNGDLSATTRTFAASQIAEVTADRDRLQLYANAIVG